MKRKIALVNQRYGLEVTGGSELLCRQFAEKLLEFYEVEVLTTCALNYTTWENYYNEGVEDINGVTVRRFRTSKNRDEKSFSKILSKVVNNPNHTLKEEMQWIDEQGPYCPDFIEYIKENGDKYDAVIYTTYLYYLTACGLINTPNDNVYLIPTAHDEPYIYLKYYKSVFHESKGFIFITDEEKKLVNNLFSVSDKPSIVAGAGVDLPKEPLPSIRENLNFTDDYILYIGRIDESKGCAVLFDYFKRYKKETSSSVKLVLVGKTVMDIPKDEDIISLGFVDELTKFAAIKECKALVLASEYESLSIVVLESLAMERPVIVNGKCEVLKGHCDKSGAGLYFKSYDEFADNLNIMLNDHQRYVEMKSRAKKYVDDNFSWGTIINNINQLLSLGWKKTQNGSQVVDINIIMDSIKAEIDSEGLHGEYAKFEDIKATTPELTATNFEIDKMITHINRANALWDIKSNNQLVKHPGIMGSIKFFIKRVLRKLMRFYVEPMISTQMEFNSNTINALNQIRNYIENQNKSNDE